MILVVCHDAGGAEIVSNYVESETQNNLIYCVKGPAIKIFKKNLKNFKNNNKILNFSKIKKLIIGTSIKSKHEIEYLKKAKKFNIQTVCFLDHWTNYKRKLTSNKKLILPNKFLVGDIHAKKLAKKIFPKTKIYLIDNPYFKKLAFKIRKIKKKIYNSRNILYLTEPLRSQAKYFYNDYRYYGYDEFSALENFLKYISIFKDKIPYSIRVRLHPSENKKKYNKIFKKYKNLKLRLSTQPDLLKDIISSNYLIGCETTALVIGLIAKKKVFCSIPKGGKKSNLPYKKIMNISKLRRYLEI